MTTEDRKAYVQQFRGDVRVVIPLGGAEHVLTIEEAQRHLDSVTSALREAREARDHLDWRPPSTR